MSLRKIVCGAVFLGLIACDAKFNKSKDSSDGQEEEAVAEGSGAEKGVIDAQKAVELQPNEVVVGQWGSQCLANPGNAIQPATVLVYQFFPDNTANSKAISYRDGACESRYTKADVDKLRARLQADATAAGAPLTDNELKELEYLWFPTVSNFTYKLGRKLSNGLIEVDMISKNADGSDKVVYGSVYFDEGLLYFAHVCAEADAQFAACSPVAGDKVDRRGKKVNFEIGFEKQALPPKNPVP